MVKHFPCSLHLTPAGRLAGGAEGIGYLLTGAGRQGRHGPGRAAPVRGPTPREREVLALMAQGHGNQAIAGLLVVSETAVSEHIRAIFAKLGLSPGEHGHRRDAGSAHLPANVSA